MATPDSIPNNNRGSDLFRLGFTDDSRLTQNESDIFGLDLDMGTDYRAIANWVRIRK